MEPFLFDSVARQELHCKSCGSLVKWGETTEYREEVNDHVCLSCDHVVDETW